MPEKLPLSIAMIFILTVIATLLLFYRALKKSVSEKTKSKANTVLFALIVWLAIQGVLTILGIYYSDDRAMPPKIVPFGVAPAIFMIIFLFMTSAGRKFIDSLPLVNITFLNIIRIPVEIVLLYLFLWKAVPKLMTFEGRNFDILAGITAPFIAYFGLLKNKLNKNVLLTWNIISLCLLINIVLNALFSAPSPLQKFAFEQPNIAILHFPFSWLPTFIVPVILFGHLVSLRQLIRWKKKDFN